METHNDQSNLLELLDRCPPFVCYYAAHRGKEKRPKLIELAKCSGLSKRTFVRITKRISWSGVTVNNMSAFCQACGVDPLAESGQVIEWLASRMASGQLAQDFSGPRGQAAKMLARLNLLAAKAVMK